MDLVKTYLAQRAIQPIDRRQGQDENFFATGNIDRRSGQDRRTSVRMDDRLQTDIVEIKDKVVTITSCVLPTFRKAVGVLNEAASKDTIQSTIHAIQMINELPADIKDVKSALKLTCVFGSFAIIGAIGGFYGGFTSLTMHALGIMAGGYIFKKISPILFPSKS